MNSPAEQTLIDSFSFSKEEHHLLLQIQHYALLHESNAQIKDSILDNFTNLIKSKEDVAKRKDHLEFLKKEWIGMWKKAVEHYNKIENIGSNFSSLSKEVTEKTSAMDALKLLSFLTQLMSLEAYYEFDPKSKKYAEISLDQIAYAQAINRLLVDARTSESPLPLENLQPKAIKHIMDSKITLMQDVLKGPINYNKWWLTAGGFTLAALFAGPLAGVIGGFMGLSGAAATSAGLALLGGGSLAAGGFGMVGGQTLLLGGGAILGYFTGKSMEGKESVTEEELISSGIKLLTTLEYGHKNKFLKQDIYYASLKTLRKSEYELEEIVDNALCRKSSVGQDCT